MSGSRHLQIAKLPVSNLIIYYDSHIVESMSAPALNQNRANTRVRFPKID